MDAEHIRQLLGANIRQLREALGYSQEALAEMTGLNRSYIGSVERSEHNAGIENISRLARALNVPVSRLFQEPREAAKNPGEPPPAQPPVEIRSVVVRAGQFEALLEQCYERTPRPDLVMEYLGRCGVRFVD
ncbi:MAG TPA: XRE family transcriptional regulator [Gammaproteobacteria bacterium]|nr:XRE family transcriptional regulator [Gammaproteobacteria bacterium]